MSDKPQIRQIFRKLGITLINEGRTFCRKAYDFNPTMVYAGPLTTVIQEVLSPAMSVSTSDLKYYLTSWDFWQWLKDLDLIDRLKYYYDTFDCDNFAFAFAAEATSCFRLNSCGVAYGAIYSVRTGELIGRHAFNIIITQETDGKHAYCYEPMNDQWAEIKKGQNIDLPHGWRYKPDWVIFF